jgi:hypothetical protein
MPDADFAICIVHVSHELDANNARYRVYFVANGDYRIRVKSVDPLWPSNLGWLLFRLYHVTQTDYTPPQGPGQDTPPEPIPIGSACTVTCIRPDSLITWNSISLGPIHFGDLGDLTIPVVSFPLPNVGDWVEYGRCSITSYLAFCPEHVEALKTVPDKFNAYEPFGSIREVMDMITIINTKLDQLQTIGGEGQSFYPYDPVWNAGGTGGEGTPADGNNWNGVVGILPSNSPWMGGEITWDGSLDPSGGEDDTGDYLTYCMTIYQAFFGNATLGLCNAIALARKLGNIWIIIQVAIDVGALLLIFKYFKVAWIDTGAAG